VKLPASPAGRRALVVAAIALLALYAAFEFGRLTAGYSVVAAMRQRQALAGRVSELTRANDDLQRRLAADSITHKVDAEAQTETQSMIGDLQAELARQQQELDFYRGLVAERFGTGTVKVQDVSVQPAGGPDYHILVTLVHTAARNATASGSLTLTLTGSRHGALSQLGLAQIAPDSAPRINFSLRYFTTVEIPVTLPEGFKPASIELEFRSNRSGPEPVRESFPWSRVLTADGDGALTGAGPDK